MSWRLICIFTLCGLACTVTTGCGNASAPKSPLRIGVIEWSGFFPVMQPQVDGGYAAADLTTTVTVFPDNPTLNAALLAGEIDVAAMVWTDVLRLGGQGHELRAIAITDWSDYGDVILAAPGITTPAGLRGKRIACEGIHTFSHLFVLNFLAKHQLREVEVELVNMPAQAVPAALSAHQIDAGHTWGPLAEAASASGCLPLDRAGLVPGSMTQVLTVQADTFRNRRAELTRMLGCFYAGQPTNAESAERCRNAAAKLLGKSAAELSPIGKEAHIVSRTEALRLMLNHDEEQGLYRSGLGIIDRLAKRGQVAAHLDPAHFILTDCIEH
jgi:NitT/TauT family transport system substrate-binding protein